MYNNEKSVNSYKFIIMQKSPHTPKIKGCRVKEQHYGKEFKTVKNSGINLC